MLTLPTAPLTPAQRADLRARINRMADELMADRELAVAHGYARTVARIDADLAHLDRLMELV